MDQDCPGAVGKHVTRDFEQGGAHHSVYHQHSPPACMGPATFSNISMSFLSPTKCWPFSHLLFNLKFHGPPFELGVLSILGPRTPFEVIKVLCVKARVVGACLLCGEG